MSSKKKYEIRVNYEQQVTGVATVEVFASSPEEAKSLFENGDFEDMSFDGKEHSNGLEFNDIETITLTE